MAREKEAIMALKNECIICRFIMMEELHTDSIDGGHEGQLWARSRARERAYSNT
jgi:hypothetical protein